MSTNAKTIGRCELAERRGDPASGTGRKTALVGWTALVVLAVAIGAAYGALVLAFLVSPRPANIAGRTLNRPPQSA